MSTRHSVRWSVQLCVTCVNVVPYCHYNCMRSEPKVTSESFHSAQHFHHCIFVHNVHFGCAHAPLCHRCTTLLVFQYFLWTPVSRYPQISAWMNLLTCDTAQTAAAEVKSLWTSCTSCCRFLRWGLNHSYFLIRLMTMGTSASLDTVRWNTARVERKQD